MTTGSANDRSMEKYRKAKELWKLFTKYRTQKFGYHGYVVCASDNAPFTILELEASLRKWIVGANASDLIFYTDRMCHDIKEAEDTYKKSAIAPQPEEEADTFGELFSHFPHDAILPIVLDPVNNHTFERFYEAFGKLRHFSNGDERKLESKYGIAFVPNSKAAIIRHRKLIEAKPIEQTYEYTDAFVPLKSIFKLREFRQPHFPYDGVHVQFGEGQKLSAALNMRLVASDDFIHDFILHRLHEHQLETAIACWHF